MVILVSLFISLGYMQWQRLQGCEKWFEEERGAKDDSATVMEPVHAFFSTQPSTSPDPWWINLSAFFFFYYVYWPGKKKKSWDARPE